MLKKNIKQKDVFYVKVDHIEIEDGEELIAVINHLDAWEYGINAYDKVGIIIGEKEIVVNADITQDLVSQGRIGLFKDIYEKYSIQEDSSVGVFFTKRSDLSVEAIKKKLRGESLEYKEMYSIIKDISENKLPEVLTTYYVASSFFHTTTDEEMYLTAKAMAETGVMFKHKEDIVADKHCIGGVPGNETTMIIVPLVASLGIKFPKNFSKAITSPAATGECVSVLMNMEFDKKGIESLLKKNNCCLVWGGGLDLAPADDRIIRVSYPISMQSYAKVVSSIMAKKYAMGIKQCLIDIPVGPTAKVEEMSVALDIKKKFEYVGTKLGMKMSVQITDALQPIGAGIGAVQQVREVLRVLQQHVDRPDDLEKKAILLSAKIIEMVGIASGNSAIELATKQLVSGEAWKKMQSIISAQGGNPNINSEEIEFAKMSFEFLADCDGVIDSIDMHYLNTIARTLGAPIDLQAGIYLNKKVGDKINVGDVVFVCYANDEHKIKRAKEFLNEKSFYSINSL